MASDKDLFTDIEKCYDSAAMTINRMTESIIDLEVKFGQSSKIVQKRREEVDRFRELYDKTLDYINLLREHNDELYKGFVGLELIRIKHESGLPYANIATLAGADPEPWRKLDDIDGQLKKLKHALGDTTQLNDFISWFRLVDQARSYSSHPQHISKVVNRA